MTRNARIKSRCSRPGCTRLCPTTYCEQHASEHVWGGTSRGTATERGYGAPWRTMRQAVLNETPMCAECLRCGRPVPATQVDHIIPKARGGTDDHANLQALCSRCHAVKTARESGRSAQRNGADGGIPPRISGGSAT